MPLERIGIARVAGAAARRASRYQGVGTLFARGTVVAGYVPAALFPTKANQS
jgi:hypothetical protein